MKHQCLTIGLRPSGWRGGVHIFLGCQLFCKARCSGERSGEGEMMREPVGRWREERSYNRRRIQGGGRDIYLDGNVEGMNVRSMMEGEPECRLSNLLIVRKWDTLTPLKWYQYQWLYTNATIYM